MFFAEDHLRITKVRTVDGTTPLIVNDRVQHKIIHAPDNALMRKLLEEENTRKPNGLKMKIERIKAHNPQAIHNSQNDEAELLKLQLAALQAENEKLKSENVLKVSANGNGNGSLVVDNGAEKQAAAKVPTEKTSSK